MTVFLLQCGNRYALERRPERGLLAGLWQFPNHAGKLDVPQALAAVKEMGLTPREIHRVAERKHIFTHVEWEMRGIYLEVVSPAGNFNWMDEMQIRQEVALPTAFRQFWEEKADV